VSEQGLLSKFLRADYSRRSRFHTSNGHLILSADIILAMITTARRHLLRRNTSLPWITYPAIRFLEGKLQGRRLFEFGSGTSTRWYATKCREVYSVENNYHWYNTVKSQIKSMSNVHISLVDADESVPEAIIAAGGKFDAIVVDSQPAHEGRVFSNSDEFRVACLRAALPRASADCLFIIDNTDAMGLLSKEVDNLFSPVMVNRFPGWVPGIFHPNETTVVVTEQPTVSGQD
jgi:hypothetical protein